MYAIDLASKLPFRGVLPRDSESWRKPRCGMTARACSAADSGSRHLSYAANLSPDHKVLTPRKPGSFLLTDLQNQKLKTMTGTVQTERELASAIKRDEDTIEITGDLANKIVRIRATGKVAWAIAFATIGVAVYAAIPTGVIGGVIGGAIANIFGGTATYSAIATAIGGSATCSAIAIAIGAGGIGVLKKLREYKEVSRTTGLLVLKRK